MASCVHVAQCIVQNDYQHQFLVLSRVAWLLVLLPSSLPQSPLTPCGIYKASPHGATGTLGRAELLPVTLCMFTRHPHQHSTRCMGPAGLAGDWGARHVATQDPLGFLSCCQRVRNDTASKDPFKQSVSTIGGIIVCVSGPFSFTCLLC